ncbi:MAG: tetratricopeptide repeat protein [Clostridia bacterium]|nr:tetratricopeptide repeat protein [Clostridia bacterium]
MIEKVIFYILAFVIFIAIFAKLIKRNDTIYIYLLVMQFFGIAIRFINITNNLKLTWNIILLLYMVSVVIPLAIIILEKKKMHLSEFICVLKAKINFKHGNNDIARKKLVKLIAKYPNSYYAHRLLAQIFEKEGKDEESIDEYVKAVDLNTKDYDSYYQIIFLLNKNGKQNESEKMLIELINKKPEYYKASELLGSILYNQEKFKQAVKVYAEALKYNPTRHELYYNLAMTYTRLNDFQTAKIYYEKAVAINSMLYHARINIAQIALITGDLDEAKARFTNCIQDKDSEPDSYYYLAIISLLKGEKDRAVSYINMAIELDNRIYVKVQSQEIFSSIIDEVRPSEGKSHRYHLTYQELITKKHLDDTFNLIDKMKKNESIIKTENNDKEYIQDKQINFDQYKNY